MIKGLTKYLKSSNLSTNQVGLILYKSHFLESCNVAPTNPNLTYARQRNFHLSAHRHAKLYADIENAYAYKILPLIPKFEPAWNPPNKITTREDFDKFLNQNWRSSTASAIVEAFEKVKDFIISHSINLQDRRFDKLVDGLMDHCEKLTDEDLLRLLSSLVEYSPTEALDSHNFHDVWSCLDDVCCWKMADWDLFKTYTFAEIWWKWNLAKRSDFMSEVIDKVTQRPQRLSTNMLLYVCFYLNVCRRRAVPFDFEHVLAQRIDEFGVDELAVIAMGYFKTRSRIRSKRIVSAMIRTVRENSDTINEITLAAMLKAIRLSQHMETAPEIPPMLDKIIEQIPRLSHLSLVHVALTGTSLRIKHELSVKKSAERILPNIENVRLKDIERMLVACSMFDIDTTPSFFDAAVNEIQKETRRKECVQYSRCLPSILNYLSLRNKYCYELMSPTLDEDYINETFGKPSRNLPRDLFSLDSCIEIECEDYKGNRLLPQKKYKAVKWLTEFISTPNQQKSLTLNDKSYLEVIDLLKSVIGEERLLRCDHVLPHFSKADIILCKNRRSGEFVEPFGFEKYILGDVKKPADGEEYEWLAVIVMTPNMTIRDKSEPLGSIVMKERQLRVVGYKPILVYVKDYAALSPPERIAAIKHQLQLTHP